MGTKKVKTTMLVSLLSLAALAVIFWPTYAGDLEPPELLGSSDTAKAKLEEECGEAEATGYSESYSFDEAFKNALNALPKYVPVSSRDTMTFVKVVEIGAESGGFAGVRHMYVRVRREADLTCLKSRKTQRPQRKHH